MEGWASLVEEAKAQALLRGLQGFKSAGGTGAGGGLAERREHWGGGWDPEARGRCLACQAKEIRTRFLPGVHEALRASVSPEMVPNFVCRCVFFLERVPGISSYFQNIKNPTVLLSWEATGS